MTRLCGIAILCSAMLVIAVILAGCTTPQTPAQNPPSVATTPGTLATTATPAPVVTSAQGPVATQGAPYAPGDLPDSSRILLGFQNIPNGTLGKNEVNDIDYLERMQKLDADLYTVMSAKYPDSQILANLRMSSEILTNADDVIYIRYNITDPESDNPGIFNDPDFQLMYYKSVANMGGNLGSLFTLAAQNEDLHITKLSAAMNRTNNQDVLFMYTQQLAGARNNLRQVAKQLNSMGTPYTPVYLSSDAYKAIIFSDMEPVNVPQ